MFELFNHKKWGEKKRKEKKPPIFVSNNYLNLKIPYQKLKKLEKKLQKFSIFLGTLSLKASLKP